MPVYILTLQLDASSFASLQALRTRHFPAPLNWIPAHLTLLHTASQEQVTRLVERWPTLGTKAVGMLYTGVKFLGRGSAIDVSSPALVALRQAVMATLEGPFTRQDQQSFRPHVTVQNKVSATQARQTYDELRRDFVPWSGQGTGVLIWRYLGGPWEFVTRLDATN